MNVQHVNVSQQDARAAVLEYKQHRGVYDKRDWEIEAIYRRIARGQTVISVGDAIRAAGFDEQARPRLAICRADHERVRCTMCRTWAAGAQVTRAHFQAAGWSRSRWTIDIDSALPLARYPDASALLPRIPPQYRPAVQLHNYWILWEADWTDVPKDPYLLKRIGKDAWVVLAAWELTDVEMMVMRSHQTI
jgi:hypothetical protein